MIDIENIVFDTIAAALRAAYQDISIYGEDIDVPAKFPAVAIRQIDNTTYQKTQDGSLRENHAQITFGADVYSALTRGSKSRAKAIMNTVDETMQGMRFTRIMMSPVPNMSRGIYRISARYTAVVAAGETSGNNTVYQIYRR